MSREVRSFYVLAYDIADDKRRVRIARLMESLGERVQGSVFEAYLNAGELQTLLRKVRKVLRAEEDGLRIYLLCEACRAKIAVEGQGRATPPPGLKII
jgi:CRISPR-associated protein Cas2